MKYVALLTGQGEGCDYTIGCNKKFEVFEAVDAAGAVRHCRHLWEDHGGAKGEPRVETIDLYLIGEPFIVPVDKWNQDGLKDVEVEAIKEELKKIETRASELRVRLSELW